MSLLEAIFLGILQGATEFLPISSSGHLVLVPAIFNLPPPDLTTIAVAHLGTLLAVLVYFRSDVAAITTAVVRGLLARKPLQDADSRLGWYIAAATLPVALAGLLLQDFFSSVFASPPAAAFFLLVTAVFLVTGERMLSGEKTIPQITLPDALVVGMFQMFALLPGISRSGSTITAGLLRGLDRATAARFSFLLGVPAILGAGLLELGQALSADALASQWPIYVGTFIAAAVTGYLCIAFLLNWLRSHSLYIFAIYCTLLGGGYLLWTLLV